MRPPPLRSVFAQPQSLCCLDQNQQCPSFPQLSDGTCHTTFQFFFGVMSLVVSLQIAFPCELLVTHRAGKFFHSFLIKVLLSVLSKIGLVREWFSTDVTGVRLLPCVDSNVGGQTLFGLAVFVAVRTLVWFLFRVSALVNLQIILTSERSATLITQKLSDL